jgi:hypothetical protein
MKVNIIDSGSNKRIDASFYKQLLYTESKNTEKVGFAQRRYIGLYQTFNSGDYSPTCPELHSQGVGDLGFLSANAMTFLIPLKWKNLYYGPFSWESEDREEGSNIIPNDTGPTSIVRNKTLNPWNYGNFDRMARAAKILSNNAQSYTSTTSFVNAEIEGYPEISLGHSLTGNVDGPNHDGSLYEVVSSLAGVTLGLSMSGITTKYRFKTYFGLVGTQLKEELDQISRGEADQDRSDKDIIKLDEIRKNLEKDEGSGEDSGEDVDRSNPYQSLAGHADAIVMTRATGQTDSRSLVTMIARSEIEEAKESRPDLSGAWNVGFDDTYVMGLSELYSACATNHQLDCEGFVPSINGIPIA